MKNLTKGRIDILELKPQTIYVPIRGEIPVGSV